MRKKTKKFLCSAPSSCHHLNKGHLKLKGYSIVRVLIIALLIVFICLVILLTIPYPNGHHIHRINIKEKAQLKSIETALELFNSEFDGYPPSDALDEDGKPYCGAMKLCEAVMGQDLLGCHPDSVFRSDGTDGKGKVLYPVVPDGVISEIQPRKGPYLPLESANAHTPTELYGVGNTGPFEPNHFVLCDVFRTAKHIKTGKNIGMPILYYKADTSKTGHNIDDPNDPNNIYDYKDNHALLALGVPGKPGVKHPMYENPKIFYEMTKDYKNKTQSKPNNAEMFILLSAGLDGLYGTKDDIANFEIEWKPQ
ncbi:MAG: hypothetical protein JXM79_07895 [Sedimentisphaerales bacterium]|nr:hypothetical protein [Sedimentisphaerales bacterium]